MVAFTIRWAFMTPSSTDIVSISSFIGTKDSEKPQVGRGRLTERLLAQGLLTPNMLQELRREWTQVR
jgi:ATP-dependent RNA helicase SUPV3L1/SUV3